MSNTRIIDDDVGADHATTAAAQPAANPGAIIILMDQNAVQNQTLDAATVQQLISGNSGSLNVLNLTGAQLTDPAAMTTGAAPADCPSTADASAEPHPDLALSPMTLDGLESAFSSAQACQVIGEAISGALSSQPLSSVAEAAAAASAEQQPAPGSLTAAGCHRLSDGAPASLASKMSSQVTRRSQRRADISLRQQAELIRSENIRQQQQQHPSMRGVSNTQARGADRGGSVSSHSATGMGSIKIRYSSNAGDTAASAVKTPQSSTASSAASAGAATVGPRHDIVTPTNNKTARGRGVTVAVAASAAAVVGASRPVVQKTQRRHNVSSSGVAEQLAGADPDDADCDDDPDDHVEDDQDEWQEEDDPDKLWCICRQPHKNRFMICCDLCEEWFHGNCVNVTRAMGRQMEEEGRDWVCPPCRRKRRQQNAAQRAIKPPSTSTASACHKNSAMRRDIVPSVRHASSHSSVSHSSRHRAASAASEIIGFEEDHSDVDADYVDALDPEHQAGQQLQQQKCVVAACGRPARPGSVYCGDRCIQVHALEAIRLLQLHEQRPPSPSSPPPPPPASSQPPLQTSPLMATDDERHVVTPGKTTAPKSPSKNIRPDFQSMLDAGSSRVSQPPTPNTPSDCVKQTPSPVKSMSSSPSTRIVVFERHTGRVLTGARAPTLANIKQWLQEHPTFEVMKPDMLSTSKFYGGAKTEASKKRLKVCVYQPSPVTTTVAPSRGLPDKPARLVAVSGASTLPTPKKPADSSALAGGHTAGSVVRRKRTHKEPEAEIKEKPLVDVERLRVNVKKMLSDVLCDRAKDMLDIKRSEIATLVNEIERYLFIMHKDVNFKYKSKYRSLMFNLKDTKNKGLFRKVLLREIEPKNLVKMSAEELASKELAQWRERAEKKELEAIEKHELDLLAMGNKYMVKTHKGELEIEKPSENSTVSDVVLPSCDTDGRDVTSDAISDTTALHNKHLFDSNCRICLRQQKTKSSDGKNSKTSSSKSRDKHSSSSHSSKHKSDRRHSSSSSSRRHHHHASSQERRSTTSSSSSSRHKSSSSTSSSSAHRRHSSSSRADKHSRSSQRRSSERDQHSSSRSRDKTAADHSHKPASHTGANNNARSSEAAPRDGDKMGCAQRESSPVRSDNKRVVTISKSVAVIDRTHIEHTEHPDNMQPTLLPLSSSSPSTTPPPSCLPSSQSVGRATTLTDTTASPCTTVAGALTDDSTDRDNQPSSTVTIKTPPYSSASPASSTVEARDTTATSCSATTGAHQCSVWRGFVAMPEICKFFAQAFEVSGNAGQLQADIPDHVEVVGRISPDAIWGYLRQIRKSSRQVIVVRLQPANDEEKLHYAALYSYLSSKERFGVVGGCPKNIKDFYIIPLASSSPVPDALLPFDGPGLDEVQQHVLLGLIVYASRKRRTAPPGDNADATGAKVARYTPPPPPLAPPSSSGPIVAQYTPSEVSAASTADAMTAPPLTFYQAAADDVELTASLDEVIRQASDDATNLATAASTVSVHDNNNKDDDYEPYDPETAAYTARTVRRPDGDGDDSDDDPSQLLSELNRRINEQRSQIRCFSDQLGDKAPYDPAEFTPVAHSPLPSPPPQNLPDVKNSPNVRNLPDVMKLPDERQASDASQQQQTADPRCQRSAAAVTGSGGLSALTDADLVAKAQQQLPDAAWCLPPASNQPALCTDMQLHNQLNVPQQHADVPMVVGEDVTYQPPPPLPAVAGVGGQFVHPPPGGVMFQQQEMACMWRTGVGQPVMQPLPPGMAGPAPMCGGPGVPVPMGPGPGPIRMGPFSGGGGAHGFHMIHPPRMPRPPHMPPGQWPPPPHGARFVRPH